MDKPKSSLDFRLMAFTYVFRDLLFPRKDILREADIQKGSHVLDYGCGPGSYIVPLSELVGQKGRIYALDIHPLAVHMVQRLAKAHQLENVETILSDCQTGLPDNSLDIALLHDTFHDLSNPNNILEELHRVLKPDGLLSFSDHHMKESSIVSKVTVKGLFRLSSKQKKTYSFTKEI